jgi:hypothetical protein
MKKVVINNYAWYVDESTNTAYENADKTGASFKVSESHLTAQERGQIYNQLYFNQ